jgi:hypothetical protein
LIEQQRELSPGLDVQRIVGDGLLELLERFVEPPGLAELPDEREDEPLISVGDLEPLGQGFDRAVREPHVIGVRARELEVHGDERRGRLLVGARALDERGEAGGVADPVPA